MAEEKSMNIYQKLQKCRVELQKSSVKKTGKNKFSNYDYFELGDFLPKINELMDKYGLTAIFNYTAEKATLTIINTEKIEETILFTTDVAIAQLKGCYEIQNIGATQTYARRYLYVMAFEIAEHDALEDTEPDEELAYKSKKIDPVKVETINSMLNKTNSDKKIFLEYYKVKRVEDITNGSFDKIMKTLEEKLNKIEKEQPKTTQVDLGI